MLILSNIAFLLYFCGVISDVRICPMSDRKTTAIYTCTNRSFPRYPKLTINILPKSKDFNILTSQAFK